MTHENPVVSTAELLSQAEPPKTAKKGIWERVTNSLHGMLATIGHIVAVFDPLRHLVVNTLVLVAVVVGGFGIYKLAAKTSFVVKDISVPSYLQEQGVTGAVVAQQILDHIAEIDAAAGSKKQKAEISGFDFQSTMPSINLPVGGLNVGAIVSELRQLLGYTETIITGEIFVEDPAKDKEAAKYGLRLRIAGQGPIYKSDAPDVDIHRLIATAAEKIMYKFDPINLGYYYYRKKDYDKADETADAALAGDTTDNYPWAYTMHGLIARDQGKLAEATENFKQVLELDPRFGMGYVNLSGILRLDGKLDEAEAAASKAVELMPKQQDAYAALAVVLMDRGKREDALEVMKKGVAASPKDAQGHLALGKLQHQLAQYEEAITSFKTSAKLAPSAAPLISAADSSLVLKRHEDALAFLRRATDAEPKNADAWMAYGAAALQRQHVRQAEKAFEKALALAPNASAPLVQLSNILVGQKRFAQANAVFEKHARNYSHDPDFFVGWSHVLMEEGKKAEAAAKRQDAFAAAHGNPVALEKLAREFESNGEIPEAIATYEKVIAADPKMAEVVMPYIEKLTARLAAKPIVTTSPDTTGSIKPAAAATPAPAKPASIAAAPAKPAKQK